MLFESSEGFAFDKGFGAFALCFFLETIATPGANEVVALLVPNFAVLTATSVLLLLFAVIASAPSVVPSTEVVALRFLPTPLDVQVAPIYSGQ